MVGQDASFVKQRIVSSVRQRGPSLPVQIAKEVGLSTLFTSAFLSELFSEKELKMSNMRIGSSPLYFVDGQEPLLERFSDNLKSKEREAFMILKEKKFLIDSEQLPAIRVALREIKDFASPFQKDDQLVWRYFTVPESEFMPEPAKEPEIKVEEKISDAPIIEESVKKERAIAEKPKKEKKIQKKKSSRKDDKFLEKVKEFLSKDSVELVGIEGLKKDELVLKVRGNSEESLLIAYNKKKLSEKDIIKAALKAKEFGLKYSVLSLNELPKRVSDLIAALENIKEIKKVE